MIKFFRKIRKNLLSEGKTRKYLKYAIGEILLVVIGILIALQINNWNENRNQANNKSKLMLALKNEFIINQEILNNYLTGLHKNNAQLNKVINYSASTTNLPIDSVRLYVSQMGPTFQFSMLNSVFEEAISSGKFEMLSDSLKQKLSLLKDFSKSRDLIMEDGRNMMSYNSIEYVDFELHTRNFEDDVTKGFYVQPPIAKHPDFIKNDDEFITYLKSSDIYKKLYANYSLYRRDEVWVKYGLLRLTTETIDLIDLELKDK